MNGRHARPGHGSVCKYCAEVITPANCVRAGWDAAPEMVSLLQSAADRFDTWLASGGPQPALDGATVAAIKEILREVDDA